MSQLRMAMARRRPGLRLSQRERRQFVLGGGCLLLALLCLIYFVVSNHTLVPELSTPVRVR